MTDLEHRTKKYDQLDAVAQDIQEIVAQDNTAPNSLEEATEYIRYNHD